ncbi:MAG: glycosyltransferase family 39 protein [Anaerolineales bacterium]|nr:glycosyltransferase family 39 protein [Anaerolineales bacterium]
MLLLGAGVRLPGLGYAEFHGDEARAVLRASAVIQGEEDVLFLHRKGPVEILAPAALFALTGQLDEANARLPFTLAGLAGLFAVWSIGWRLLSPAAGWLAALLLAVTGYYVAFSRFLQYQSVVILTTAAALLAVAALFQERRAPTRRLLLAALLLATGLLAHYDALAAAPPLAVLLIAAYIRWRAVASLS